MAASIIEGQDPTLTLATDKNKIGPGPALTVTFNISSSFYSYLHQLFVIKLSFFFLRNKIVIIIILYTCIIDNALIDRPENITAFFLGSNGQNRHKRSNTVTMSCVRKGQILFRCLHHLKITNCSVDSAKKKKKNKLFHWRHKASFHRLLRRIKN